MVRRVRERVCRRCRRIALVVIQNSVARHPPHNSGLSALTSRSVSMSRSRSVVDPSSAGAARGGGASGSSIGCSSRGGNFPSCQPLLREALCLEKVERRRKKKKTNHFFTFEIRPSFYSLLTRRASLLRGLLLLPEAQNLLILFHSRKFEQEREKEQTRE